MTFGISNYDGDMLADYRDSTGIHGLAAALSGSFQASPSFEMEAAVNPGDTMSTAGTGLSRARDVNAGALTVSEALNYTPKNGPMIPVSAVLGGIDTSNPWTWIAILGAGYFGRKRFGDIGAVVGPLAALGVMKLFDK